MDKLNSIWLVDDDEVNNFLNSALLQELNVAKEIRVISDGQEALNQLREIDLQNKKLPQLIILDIHMPCMDGEEFLLELNDTVIKQQEIKSLKKTSQTSAIADQTPNRSANPKTLITKEKIKIIILSALLQEKRKILLLEMGVSDFIEKPLTAKKLTESLLRQKLLISEENPFQS